MNNQTVVGVFNTAEEAANAVTQLKAANFSTESVDHANRGAGYNQQPAGGMDAQVNTSGTWVEGAADAVDRGVSGAANSVSNAAANANQGPVGGMDAHVNSSGTMAEAAADKVDEGTSAIGRFFANLFTDDEETASRYTGVAHSAQSIVTVHADSEARAHSAALIMDNCGAVDVDERAQEMGWSAQTGWDNAQMDRTAAPGETLKVVEETLNVGKKEVETGGARLRSRVVSRPVEEQLRLREEHVFVNRTPVNRAATEADFTTFKEGTVEMRETAEVPVVSKEARVVEEVSLGKEVTERQETIRDTVRNTEVDVEQIPGTAKNLTDRDGNNNMNK